MPAGSRSRPRSESWAYRLSPDSLVLPKEAKALPPGLRDAAIGLLGKAWAVATAPAAALPNDVQRFSKKIVFDRAVEVAEAGFRVSLHEPLADSAAHLAMDFMGSKFAWLPQFNQRPEDLVFAQDNFRGFDALRRQSVRGDRFADAVAGILAPGLAITRTADLPLDPCQPLVAIGPSTCPRLSRAEEAARRRIASAFSTRRAGESADRRALARSVKEIPFSDLLVFQLPGGGIAGEMAVLASPLAGAYKIRLDKIASVS